MFLDCKPQTIVVFGDSMLDYRNTGITQKIANEAPIPVFLKKEECVSLGGCGNVVQNLYALGCEKIYVFSMCGDDTYGQILNNLFTKLNVEAHILPVQNKKTTVKHRFFCQNKLVFRYDEEEQYTVSREQEVGIINDFTRILSKTHIDCILFSDYNKGFLSHSLCQEIIKIANDNKIFTCVDPKMDYTKYTNCSLIKPNREEVEKLFHVKVSHDNLSSVHQIIKDKTRAKTSIITLGDQGISGSFEEDTFVNWKYESKDVIDVTGAGDVVNAILAFYFNQIPNKEIVLKLASYIATISVSHLGTYTIQYKDILEGCKYVSNKKVVRVEDLKKLKQPLLLTNGCFDILHEGHISLFEYCKSLAKNTHECVIALNSDASIKRLKGHTRPICSLQTRVSILNAIKDIDWILIFEDDTPERILKELQPDILVKGGDYTLETIVGREYCKVVYIYPFKHQISSTTIINKFK
jgi:D-beta-D-heptose 7-phosphate kinase/D-beta-D-heptose 1-phosphate adenosyltransferase